MIRGTGLFSITLLLSVASAPLHAQEAPRQDSSVAIIDSLRPKVIPRHVELSRDRSRSCHGFSQTKCSLLGALFIGGIGWLAGDVSTPGPKYEYRSMNGDASLVDRRICIEHCGIPRKAIVFSLGGATIGGVAGWFTGTK